MLSATVFVAALAIGLVSSLWAISTAARIQERWETQLLRGVSSVRVVEALGGPLSGARCDDLNRVVGVRSSGGLIQERLVSTHGRPGSRVYLQRVTPGYAAVAFPAEPDLIGAGVVAGRDVASRLEIHDGVSLPLLNAPGSTPDWLTIDRAVTTDARIAGAGGAVLVAAAADVDVSECVVDIEPAYLEAVVILLQGWFDGENTVVGPFLPGDDTRADPHSDLTDRPTRFAGIGAGLLLAVSAVAMWLTRRGELSLYVLLGLGYRQLLVMAAAETLVLLAAPFSAGVAVAVLGSESLVVPATLATFPSDLALAAPVVALIPWLSIMIITTARPLLVLRES